MDRAARPPGSTRIVICGTTGEGRYALHARSSCTLIAHAVGLRGGPLQDHRRSCGCNATVPRAGTEPDGRRRGRGRHLLLVTPYYNKCTQAGLIAHYLDDRRSAVTCPGDRLQRSRAVPAWTSLSETYKYASASTRTSTASRRPAATSIAKAARITERLRRRLLPSGPATTIPAVSPLVALGGRGVISVLSNVRPARDDVPDQERAERRPCRRPDSLQLRADAADRRALL